MNWEKPPQEFWRLHPREFWWHAEARRPQKKNGGLALDELEELHQMLREAEQEEA